MNNFETKIFNMDTNFLCPAPFQRQNKVASKKLAKTSISSYFTIFQALKVKKSTSLHCILIEYEAENPRKPLTLSKLCSKIALYPLKLHFLFWYFQDQLTKKAVKGLDKA